MVAVLTLDGCMAGALHRRAVPNPGQHAARPPLPRALRVVPEVGQARTHGVPRRRHPLGYERLVTLPRAQRRAGRPAGLSAHAAPIEAHGTRISLWTCLHRQASFVARGDLVAVCFQDDTIMMWELETLALRYRFALPEQEASPGLQTIAVSEDYKVLVAR